ncbi:Sapep family Mn(2+)-dependent dipeptidase [Paenibacillus filicis]|uniref:Sapep family Mn(2+)-dependent dipeptidase n=1 Tax=Paenibacillus filicis TaxID=669464 RepID=A0ABU9DGH2_9BACL
MSKETGQEAAQDLELEKRIDDWIRLHQDELLADIALLVSIPSVATESAEPKVYGKACAEALEAVLALGERYGFRTSNTDYRCGVIEGGGAGQRSVGIWGHTDVVPAGDGWVYPPFQSTRVGDFLIGRGVQDNKGPVVAVLYALRCIRELGLPLRYMVKQIIGSAEEIGMGDAVYVVQHGDVPDFNIVADSGFPVCYGEKGLIQADLISPSLGGGAVLGFRAGSASNIVPGEAELTLRYDEGLGRRLQALPETVTVTRVDAPGELPGDLGAVRLTARGIPGHAAFPSGSINAIHVLLDAVLAAGLLDAGEASAFRFIAAVCATYDGAALGIACADEVSGELTCVGAIGSLVRGEARLNLNIRCPITADASVLLKALEQSAAGHGFTLDAVQVNKGNRVDKDAPEVRLLNDTFNRVMGTQKEPFVMGGGTYARKLPHAVGFGPGMPADVSVLGLPEGHGQIHGPDEAQSIPNLLAALKVYVMALLALNEWAES